MFFILNILYYNKTLILSCSCLVEIGRGAPGKYFKPSSVLLVQAREQLCAPLGWQVPHLPENTGLG